MELDIDVLIRLGDGIVVLAGGRVVPTYTRFSRILVKCMTFDLCAPYVGGGRSPPLCACTRHVRPSRAVCKVVDVLMLLTEKGLQIGM